jgi:hypothetical protein
MSERFDSIPQAVQQSALRLQQPQAMRRGSLSERYVKCSKPGCPCGQDPDARHGPYYSVTRGIAGKTHSRFVTAEQAEIVRQQIAAGQQFRQQVEDYWAVCEQWADEQLRGGQELSDKEGKKRALKKPSRKPSPGKSTS